MNVFRIKNKIFLKLIGIIIAYISQYRIEVSKNLNSQKQMVENRKVVKKCQVKNLIGGSIKVGTKS